MYNFSIPIIEKATPINTTNQTNIVMVIKAVTDGLKG